MRMLLVFILSIAVCGCASYFKKRECDKTDWHEHGYQVAMTGKRLDADPFITECLKLDESTVRFQEADLGFKEGMNRYCNLESVFATGKKGVVFNYDLCDGLSKKAMTKRFQEGVAIYCVKENGFPTGRSGAAYNGVCPKNLEPDFLSEYRRGRKVYIASLISAKEAEIDDIEREISRYRSDRDNCQRDLGRLGSGRIIVRESKYDPLTRTYKEVTHEEDDPGVKSKRQRIESDIESFDRNIRFAEDKRTHAREEIRKLREEDAGL